MCAYGSYLDMKLRHCLELDVFLIDAETCVSGYAELTKNWSFCQVFRCSQELFVCFSSVLIRTYINCTLNALLFSSSKVIPNKRNKAFNLSLADEKKILLIIFKHAKIFLDKSWYRTNFKFFYDFFYQLDTVNSSSCFRNFVSKPKFGPYNFPDYCHVTWEYH